MLQLKKLIRSFYYAGRGIIKILKEEQNFRLQFLAALSILILAIYFKIKVWEIITLLLVIIIVLVLELINSIFERLVDMLKPRLHSYARDIKNIMSATVLVASLGALIIGLLIFWPYFFNN